ncbi:hypothetical protein J2S78_000132 [Salibacterium salarium]|uniref:hypothetical protein n=1 Tax=Salibacterium salarium TaxID=284579 RepID=UPI0027877290|nr:hypothetical protein [Salibacterium salarium]MDQ0297724.1 hypothetical protein [Salibacterium salarium]
MNSKNSTLTNTELTQIRERTDNAAPGPWEIGRKSPNGANNIGTLNGILTAQTTKDENAVFIANARADVPNLLSHIAQQEKIIQKYKHTIKNMDALVDYVRYSEKDKGLDTQYITNEITRLIADLEQRTHLIT